MRRIIQWTLVPAAAIAVAACSKGGSRTPTAMNDDLKRDLKLASQTQSMQINPDEVSPKSQQQLALKPKKAPEGPKVIRSEHPTVKASARAVQVAEIKTDIPQVQVLASAPAPSETPTSDAPPLARPSAVPTQGYPGAQPIPGNGGGGGGIGAIFGSILRGGVVDDDHCDPRGGGGRRGGGHANPGDIYHPNGTGGMMGAGGILGMPGGRVPRGRP
ncbi:MAG: hypothetical protein JWM41_4049 [Gemmatimonadetes bacterium]|nr:hypothetical protein [Gemmatimonadota bacterium]